MIDVLKIDFNINHFLEITLGCARNNDQRLFAYVRKDMHAPRRLFRAYFGFTATETKGAIAAEGAGSDPSSFLADAEAKSRINR